MAAYFAAATSVSGVRPLLTSATTRRPSAPSPSTLTRSRTVGSAVGSPSNSKVMTLTAGPRMAGLERTHSCKSARPSRPASSSEIICAGIATDPATVNSISSAIRRFQGMARARSEDVSKVTRTRNGASTFAAVDRALCPRIVLTTGVEVQDGTRGAGWLQNGCACTFVGAAASAGGTLVRWRARGVHADARDGRTAGSDGCAGRHQRPRALELHDAGEVEQQLLGVAPADDLHREG